jgi:hypothetical protein
MLLIDLISTPASSAEEELLADELYNTYYLS